MKINFKQFGEGAPIVLLHAFPLSSEMCKPQIDAIVENNFSLITPDFRGFGQSILDGSASLEDFAIDVNQLLDDLKIRKAIIGGLSMGGYVLFNMYQLFPERFSAIILADTNASEDTQEKRKGRFELINQVEISGSQVLKTEMLPKLISNHTKKNNSDLLKNLEIDFSKLDDAAVINALQAMANRKDHSGILPQINVPTLIIFGEEDQVTNLEIAKNMHEQITDSQFVTLKNSGHFSNLEQPEQFNASLLNFLNSL